MLNHFFHIFLRFSCISQRTTDTAAGGLMPKFSFSQIFYSTIPAKNSAAIDVVVKKGANLGLAF
jgi:hypothetical protein